MMSVIQRGKIQAADLVGPHLTSVPTWKAAQDGGPSIWGQLRLGKPGLFLFPNPPLSLPSLSLERLFNLFYSTYEWWDAPKKALPRQLHNLSSLRFFFFKEFRWVAWGGWGSLSLSLSPLDTLDCHPIHPS